jgi:hypothetical protein
MVVEKLRAEVMLERAIGLRSGVHNGEEEESLKEVRDARREI